jgi:hypothetical protein
MKSISLQSIPFNQNHSPFIVLYISEAERQEQINKASGEAQAMLAIAEARAKGLELVARPLKTEVTFLTFSLSIVIATVEVQSNKAVTHKPF